MDTKKLRQKILDLAIHGKLVPQDPNDEPASVLLERIKAEKEQLIKEGKIKRQKKSASSDTSHYENIPTGWANTTIGEVFNLQAGKNISSKEIHPTQSHSFQYPCYGGNGIRGYVSTPNRDGNHPIIGRQGALCGNVNLANGAFYATEHAVVVQLYCNMDLKWVFYVLTALNLNQYATATAQPGLAVNVIDDVPLLLPPIQEQERISRKIDTFFSLLESLETNIMCLNSDVQKVKSLILALALSGKLTSHTSHYGKWPYLPLSEIFNITMGQSPDGYYINQNNDGIEFHQGKLHFGQRHLLNSGVFTSNVTKVADAYSLLMCVRAPVGVLNITDRKVCIGRGLCTLKPKDSNMPIEYWYYALSSLSDYFEENSTGSTFKAITMDVIKTTYVHVPPINEQRLIARQLEHIYQIINSILKM